MPFVFAEGSWAGQQWRRQGTGQSSDRRRSGVIWKLFGTLQASFPYSLVKCVLARISCGAFRDRQDRRVRTLFDVADQGT